MVKRSAIVIDLCPLAGWPYKLCDAYGFILGWCVSPWPSMNVTSVCCVLAGVGREAEPNNPVRLLTCAYVRGLLKTHTQTLSLSLSLPHTESSP